MVCYEGIHPFVTEGVGSIPGYMTIYRHSNWESQISDNKVLVFNTYAYSHNAVRAATLTKVSGSIDMKTAWASSHLWTGCLAQRDKI